MKELRHLLREEVLHQGPGAKAAHARAAILLARYEFYPRSILVGRVPPGGIRKGAIIDQRIRVGLLRFHGPVRIVDAWNRDTDAAREAGYSYEALPGHPERGIATFALRLDKRAQTVTFRIESRSAPAHWIARIGAPFARAFQRRAVDGAFKKMRVAAEDRR